MINIKALFCATVVGGLVGCATAPQQSLYRWAPGSATGMTPASGAAPPKVTVSSQPVDPPGALSVRTLPERAAAAYIAGVAKTASDVGDFRDGVSKPIKKVPSDPSELARVFVIDVQRTDIRPSDRFMSVKIEIEPSDSRYHFVDFQSASTTNNTISIGTVSISNSLTGSAGISPTIGAGVPQLGASVGYTNSNASTHNISETGQLSVNASPGWIVVQRTGVEGVDLLGNALVQAALKADEKLVETFYVVEPDVVDDKTNALKPPAKAALNGGPTGYFRPREIDVCYRVTYVNRIVQSGDEMRDEGAQTVAFVRGEIPLTGAIAVSKDETLQTVWYLSIEGLGAVKAETSSGNKTMLFDDYDMAQTFRAWLQKTRSSTIGGQQVLGPDDRPIAASELGRLGVVRGFPDAVAPDAAPTPRCKVEPEADKL